MKEINFRQIISVIALNVCLASCGGAVESILSDIDEDIKTAEKNRDSTFKLINATNEMTSFYIRPLGISDEIFSSEYEATSLLKGEVSEQYFYSWNEHLSRTELAVIDSVSLTKKDKTEHTIENGKFYWGIAWLDNNTSAMSIIDTISNPDSDSYSIRFFSMSDQDIFIGESDIPLVTALKGEVTPVFTYDNCAEIEAINNNSTDFCQIANVGETYLAVIGENGEVTLGQE